MCHGGKIRREVNSDVFWTKTGLLKQNLQKKVTYRRQPFQLYVMKKIILHLQKC
ncbi:putative helix-turn-helix domain protein [Priestia megaterium]|nr:putative helix-turn-helix domain protein [Priestia megaterium]